MTSVLFARVPGHTGTRFLRFGMPSLHPVAQFSVCTASSPAPPTTSDLLSQASLRWDAPLHSYRQTRIVATLGPSSMTRPVLTQMLEAGMDVARINCAHGDKELYARMVEEVRAAETDVMRLRHHMIWRKDDFDLWKASRQSCTLTGIAFDIKGPEIRVGTFQNGTEVKLTKGDRVQIVTAPELQHRGDVTINRIFISYPPLAKQIQPGHKIYIVRIHT